MNDGKAFTMNVEMREGRISMGWGDNLTHTMVTFPHAVDLVCLISVVVVAYSLS